MTIAENLFDPEGLPLEPRCHVCRDDAKRELVNGMLARGCSYAQIARSMVRPPGEPPLPLAVTVNSVRNHATRHFPVHNVAKAAYREIIERRAAQNRIDFVDGLATAVTPIAYLETIMVKAFGTLVDDATQVGVETGLRAAEKLHRMAGDVDPGAELIRLRVDVGRIIETIKATVPQPVMDEILRKLEGRGQDYLSAAAALPRDSAWAAEEDDEDEDTAFDPVEDGDDDDF